MKDENDLILINGEYYSQNELVAIIESNEELGKLNVRYANFIRALKSDNSALTTERNELHEKLHAKTQELADQKREYEEFYEKEYMARIDECNRLWGELFDIKHMSMWEFANKYCSSQELEEAGHQLARSLLGGD